jgi:hypothetical protein
MKIKIRIDYIEVNTIINFSKFYLFDDLNMKPIRMIFHTPNQLPHDTEHYSNYKQVRTYVRKYIS